MKIRFLVSEDDRSATVFFISEKGDANTLTYCLSCSDCSNKLFFLIPEIKRFIVAKGGLMDVEGRAINHVTKDVARQVWNKLTEHGMEDKKTHDSSVSLEETKKNLAIGILKEIVDDEWTNWNK
jgi:hypothetical protein